MECLCTGEFKNLSKQQRVLESHSNTNEVFNAGISNKNHNLYMKSVFNLFDTELLKPINVKIEQNNSNLTTDKQLKCLIVHLF